MTPLKKLELFYRSLKIRKPPDYEQYSNLSGPDLIWLGAQYFKSHPRIAIIGQQIGEWYYYYPEFIEDWAVRKAMEKHKQFDFACSNKEEDQGYGHSPFWKFFHEVRKRAFPNKEMAHRKVLWTNLVKFVARGKRSLIKQPFAEVEKAIQLQEDVLVTELKIAKPKVCLFVTGPDYDCLLRRYFKGLKFKPLDLPVKKFARLVHPQLPFHSYRTYHPGFLNRRTKLRKRVFRILERKLNWQKSRG